MLKFQKERSSKNYGRRPETHQDQDHPEVRRRNQDHQADSRTEDRRSRSSQALQRDQDRLLRGTAHHRQVPPLGYRCSVPSRGRRCSRVHHVQGRRSPGACTGKFGSAVEFRLPEKSGKMGRVILFPFFSSSPYFFVYLWILILYILITNN